jgi:hypothetical protein
MKVYRRNTREYSRQMDSTGVKVRFVERIGALVDVKYEKAKKIYTAAKRPTDKQVQSYKNAKKKSLSAVLRLSQTSPFKVRKPGLRSTPIKRKKPPFKEVGFIDFK